MMMIKWQRHIFMDPCCAVKLPRHVWITDRCGWELLVSIRQKRNTFSRMVLHTSTFREKNTFRSRKENRGNGESCFFYVLLTRLPEIHCFNLFNLNAISTTKAMYKFYPGCPRLHWDLKVNYWKSHDVWRNKWWDKYNLKISVFFPSKIRNAPTC